MICNEMTLTDHNKLVPDQTAILSVTSKMANNSITNHAFQCQDTSKIITLSHNKSLRILLYF